MRKDVLFVLGSVLIIISALLLIFDSSNPPSSAYNQEAQLNSYDCLQKINEEKTNKIINESYLSDYDNVNLIFSKSDTNSLENIQYNLENEKVQWMDNKLIIAEEGNREKEINLKIKYGLNGSEISSLLVDKNLIKDKEKFIKLLLKFDIDRKLVAGDYTFNPHSTPVDILLSITGE